MKLKKIVSLALAGILAVSMLTACGDKGSSSSEGTEVKPVDNSFAASINEELDDNQKAIVTFSADAELESALSKAAGMIDVGVLKATSPDWLADGNVTKSFMEMLKADGASFQSVFADKDKDQTAANIYVVPGNYTEEGMKDAVVSMLDTQITSTVMPAYDTVGGKDYKYSYAGNVAVVKVDSNDGKYSAYVVGIVIDQTVTEIAK